MIHNYAPKGYNAPPPEPVEVKIERKSTKLDKQSTMRSQSPTKKQETVKKVADEALPQKDNYFKEMDHRDV